MPAVRSERLCRGASVRLDGSSRVQRPRQMDVAHRPAAEVQEVHRLLVALRGNAPVFTAPARRHCQAGPALAPLPMRPVDVLLLGADRKRTNLAFKVP